MFFPFTDYDIIEVTLNGQDDDQIRKIYTTSFPSLMFLEIEPGRIPGFNFSDKTCYFDIEYTGDADFNVRTYLWGDPQATLNAAGGTSVVYCPRSNVDVFFDIRDDDYSGTVRLHVLALPTSTQITP